MTDWATLPHQRDVTTCIATTSVKVRRCSASALSLLVLRLKSTVEPLVCQRANMTMSRRSQPAQVGLGAHVHSFLFVKVDKLFRGARLMGQTMCTFTNSTVVSLAQTLRLAQTCCSGCCRLNPLCHAMFAMVLSQSLQPIQPVSHHPSPMHQAVEGVSMP